jgi:hypothetical protein
MNKPYVKKCITICIQGHGGVVRSKSGAVDIINSKLRHNVSILNIPGGVGSSGLMQANCAKMTVKGSKKRGISDINLCGEALDIMSMEYFHNLYDELSKKPNITGCDVSKEGIEIIRENIPLIYGKANIPYFHDEDDVVSNPTEAYRLSNPYYNKLFTMYPNTHEYCDSETSDCKIKKCDMEQCQMGKCKLLRKELRDCPEYGITVVHSTIPSDREYTLGGLPMIYDNINIQEKNRLAVNLNQNEGHNPLKIMNGDDDGDGDDEYIDEFDEDGNTPPRKESCYEFWKVKLSHNETRETREIQSNITYYRRKKQGSPENIELGKECDRRIKKLEELQKKIRLVWFNRITVYDLMTNVFERDIPISTLPSEEVETLPRVTLEQLIDIFINGMKYDHIYIIDPTCNGCEFTGKRPTKLFKTVAYNVLERVGTKKNRLFVMPVVSKKRRNKSSGEFDNRLESIQDFKRTRLSMLPIVYKKRENNPSDGFNNPREPMMDVKRRKSLGGKRKTKRGKLNGRYKYKTRNKKSMRGKGTKLKEN